MDERSRLPEMGSDDFDGHTFYICGPERRVLWWWYHQRHASSAHSLALPTRYRHRVRVSYLGVMLAADGNPVANIRLAV